MKPQKLTALIATSPTNWKSVKKSIKAGAQINADHQGITTLILAAWKNNLEMVAFCLEQGADVNFNVEGNINALYAAERNKNQPMIDLLLKHGAKHDIHTYLLSQLWRKQPDWDGIKDAIEHGANPNNVIIETAARGNISMVTYLLNKGASINITDHWGWTPLMHAAKKNNLELVTYLVKHGALVKHKDKFDDSALQFAVQHNNLPMAMFLLDQGATIDERMLEFAREFPYLYSYLTQEKG